MSLPLDGIRVVDLTRFVSGSYATFMLSVLGAEVIKVERPPNGDPYRASTEVDESLLFMSLNSGKRSVGLDFTTSEGRAALDRILSGADVMVENSRPGSLAKHGLDYASVRERHPSLVYASISGFGDVGPDADRGGFDLILQAASGLMGVTGHPDTGPAKVGAPVADVGSGLACVIGVLSALLDRAKTNSGSQVSTSLLEFSLASLATVAASFLTGGESPGLLGTHSPTFAPYGAFRARDGWLVLAGAGSEDLWKRCCHVLGGGNLINDPRYFENASRVEHREQLSRDIEALLQTRTVDEWLQLFGDAGVPAGRINGLGEAFSAPQVEALGIVQTLTHPDSGEYPVVGIPIRFGRRPLPVRSAAPMLGEHTRTVLGEEGMSEEDIDSLIARGHAMET